MILNKFPNLTLIILALSLLALSIFINQKYPQKSAYEINNFHSPNFHSQTEVDELRKPSKAEAIQITLPEFDFQTQMSESGNKLNMWFVYFCEPECEQLWLSLLDDQGQPTNILVHHKIIEDLPWFKVIDQGLTFYQKNPEYKTIDEYFADPNRGILLTEKSIVAALNLPTENVIYLEDNFDIGNAEAVLTTHSYLTRFQDWVAFNKVIPIPTDKQSAGSILNWQLTHKSQTDIHPDIWIAQFRASIVE
jgi:hypothetical protein